jgi:hypothetical protein
VPLIATELVTHGSPSLCAKRRPEQVVQTEQAYSITSSVWASSVGGMVRPSILAVWALMASSNLVEQSVAEPFYGRWWWYSLGRVLALATYVLTATSGNRRLPASQSKAG